MPRETQVMVRCSEQWKRQLRQEAERQGRSVSDLVRQAVNELLARQGAPHTQHNTQ